MTKRTAVMSLAVLCSAVMVMWAATPVMATSDIVISQVYPGAGCSTAGCSLYTNDYIELFNRGSSTIAINGWSVQYASATGAFTSKTNIVSGSIPPGGYFLIQCAGNTNGLNPLPTPDLSGSLSLSATAGKVALVNNQTLAPSCTDASVLDLVGYGTTASCYEGSSRAPTPGSNNNAIFRAGAGCTDTDDNGADFSAATADPRNSSSPANPCGGPPTAACCHGGYLCVINTQAECLALSGTWLSGTTSCSGNPCGYPTGSCCNTTTWACQDNVVQADCAAPAVWTQGGTCAVNCAAPTGSCCLPDGTCATGLTQAQCSGQGGNQWTEGATNCVPACVPANMPPIIISEYYESAPGNRKAIEIYNTSASTVDLTGAKLALYSNQATTPTATFSLTGYSIGAQSVLVFVNNLTDTIPGLVGTPIAAPGVCSFNGDDAIAILFNVNGVDFVVDAFAIPGQQDSGPRGADPYMDSAWERSCSVTAGTANFDPCNFDGLKDCGLAVCPPGTPASCTDGEKAGEWVFEGRNPTNDNWRHTLGSHCSTATGACCTGDTCTITTWADCLATGSLYKGDGTGCTPNPCLTQLGACCVGSACSVQLPEDCAAAGGTYLGAGSICTNVVCGCKTAAGAKAQQGVQDASGVIVCDVVVSNLISLINNATVKSFQVQDATGGMTVFASSGIIDALLSNDGNPIQEGHTITISGTTDEYNGLFELSQGPPLPLKILAKSGTITPVTPESILAADLQDGNPNAELIESKLVKLMGVTFIETGTFAYLPSGGYHVTDGVNTVVVRIATESLDLIGTAIPTVPVDIVGIVTQYDTTAPYNAGYQLLPRSLADITPSDVGCTCPGNTTNDANNRVDENDIPSFIQALLEITPHECADVNGDEVVDGRDIQLFVQRVLALTPCGPVEPPARAIVQCDGSNPPCQGDQIGVGWCHYEVIAETVPGVISCAGYGLGEGVLFCVPCNGQCDPVDTIQTFKWIDRVSPGVHCFFKARVYQSLPPCYVSCPGGLTFNNYP